MPRQPGLATALEDMGLDVVVYAGWPTRGSDTFNPHGVVLHHTGPWSTIEGMVQLCIHGRAGLPGPLCHVVVDPVGVCHVIAAGRANHAGEGGWMGLTGNASVFGIEAIHEGKTTTPWPEVQVAAMELAAAALVRLCKSDPDHVCGHKEWAPRRKIDPILLNMADTRQRISQLLHPAPREVKPMYDPPISLAAVWQADGGEVLAGVSPDGSVYAWGVRWMGNTNGKPYWGDRRAAQIGVRPDGEEGYRITATDGATYDLPDGMDAV